jgi:putative ABC transport system ATP-binding protein
MPSAIDIQHLNFSFGEGELRKQVLYDVSFQVEAGTVVILMGPSGCGKTTLLTLVGGLRSLQDGEVNILGHRLHHASQPELVAVRRHIGFVFQLHNLLDFLTAQQNVEMSLQLHPEVDPPTRRHRAQEMLKVVGLGERLDYYPAALSGGQRQRVSIARALVAQPRLILADEPTAALDSTSGRQVVELLQQLAKEQGATVLMVTHDNRILDLADRIVHMEDGRILDAG